MSDRRTFMEYKSIWMNLEILFLSVCIFCCCIQTLFFLNIQIHVLNSIFYKTDILLYNVENNVKIVLAQVFIKLKKFWFMLLFFFYTIQILS